MGRAVKDIAAEPPRRIAPEIAAKSPIGGPCLASTLGATERHVAAPEDAAADLAVELARQHDGQLQPVIVIGPVQERPVGQRPVVEIVGMGVLLVQIAEGPECPARL